MSYQGDYAEDYATLNFKFTSRQFGTGAPFTLGGTPALSVYKANGTTESIAGITLTEDFDSLTGCNHVLIDLSADAFYAVGNDYQVIINTGTVDGVSVVGEVVATFSIENRFAEVALNAQGKLDVNEQVDTALSDYDGPTNAEMVARTIVAANYFDPAADTVANVTTTANLTTNNDKTGYSVSAAVASFFQDFFTVDSGEVSGAEVSGSAILEIAKVVWDRALTGATHNIGNSSGRRLRGLQEFQGYALGAIWIDTVNGTAGTTNFENGTVNNPVLTLADAITLATSLNLKRFVVTPGSSITFAEAHTAEVWVGSSWTLVLGAQDCSDSQIIGADVSGTATSPTGKIHLEECEIATATIGEAHFRRCTFEATLTLSAAAFYLFESCGAGGDTCVIDIGVAVANQHLDFHRWSGTLELQNVGQSGTDSIHLDGAGELTINVNCNGGTIDVHGLWDIVDNGSSTLEKDDITTDVDAILVDTSTTLDTKLNDIQGAAFVSADDSLEALRNRGDAAWITAINFSTHDAAAVWSVAARVLTANTNLNDPTSATIAAAVWDAVQSSHIIAGSFGIIASEIATLQTSIDDVPTVAEFNARTLVAANYFDPAADTVTLVTTTTTVTNQVTADVTALNGVAASAVNLERSASTIVTGKAEAGTLSVTEMTTDLTEATDDHYNGRVLIWTSGVLQNQATDITDYVGATGKLTYTGVTEAPSAADTFVIL